MTALKVCELENRQDWREFSKLKEQIYSSLNVQEEPWEESRKLRFLSQHDPHRQIKAFLAYRHEQAVGRIAAIVDQRHRPQNEGFFGFFECIEDLEAAQALLSTAAQTLKSWGKHAMIGPISASTNEKVGIMIEGFGTLPHPNLTYNPPYYQNLLEASGLVKAMGLLSYLWTKDLPLPGRLSTIQARALERYSVTVHFPAKGNINEEATILQEVYNESLNNNWGFVPLTFEEARGVILEYRFSPHPDLLFRLDVEGEPAGICLLQLNPRPELKKSDPRIRAAVMGLRPKFRKKGLSTVLILKAIELALEQGYEQAEVSLIMENNLTVRSLIENTLGCPVLHRYQVYRTNLD